MNALRQEAFRIMESMPDDGVLAVIKYMNQYNENAKKREERLKKKEMALEGILSLSKHVQDFDEEKELMSSREERFL